MKTENFEEDEDYKDLGLNQFKKESTKLKENESKLLKDEKDLLAVDKNKRTILHRSALEQNSKLMNEIILNYIEILEIQLKEEVEFGINEENYLLNRKNIQNQIYSYVNKEDKFGNTPIINLCSQKNLRGMKIREDCLM